MTVSWGIVGSSSWSDSIFAPAIVSTDNATLHAVLSSSAEKAASFCQRHGAEHACSNIETFVGSAIDAVWVASPTPMHADHAIAALNAGKHVLCEKPMALSVAQCEKMVAAAEQSGALLSIGYHMRHLPAHREVAEEWQRGDYGVPAAARAQLYFAYPELPDPWRLKRESSGGWALGDIATHLVDQLRWALGDVESVHGELANPGWGLEVEDLAVLSLRFENGRLGIADASTGIGAPASRIELYGTEGCCILEGTAFGTAFGGAPGTITRSRGGKDPEQVAAKPANPYALQVEAFGRAIAGDEALRVSPRDGLENIRVLENARGY